MLIPCCNQPRTEQSRGSGAGPFLPNPGLLQRALCAQVLPISLVKLSQSCTIHRSSSDLNLFSSLSFFRGVRSALQPEGSSTFPALSPLCPSEIFSQQISTSNSNLPSASQTYSTEKKVTPILDGRAEYGLCLTLFLFFFPSYQLTCKHLLHFRLLSDRKIQAKTDEVPCHEGGLPL